MNDGVDAQAQAGLDDSQIEQRQLPGIDQRNPARTVRSGCSRPRAPSPSPAPATRRTSCTTPRWARQLAVAHPADGAIDGRAAGLVRKQPRDLRIGEGLDEAHGDRQRSRRPTTACRRWRRPRRCENSTSGGTPLATQNAPVQSMPRSRPRAFSGARRGRLRVSLIAANTLTVPSAPLSRTQRIQNTGAIPRRFQRCLPRCHTWRPRISMPRHRC